jgi:hypothetical protein
MRSRRLEGEASVMELLYFIVVVATIITVIATYMFEWL